MDGLINLVCEDCVGFYQLNFYFAVQVGFSLNQLHRNTYFEVYAISQILVQV
jgi:hypothetical protein